MSPPFSYVVAQNGGYVMVVSLGGFLSCPYATAELLYRVNEGFIPRLKLCSQKFELMNGNLRNFENCTRANKLEIGSLIPPNCNGACVTDPHLLK